MLTRLSNFSVQIYRVGSHIAQLLYQPHISRTMFQPVVISGPSGSGKSTLVKKLMDQYPSCFAFSVSHTTRQPRPGEEDGREYHFVSRESMQSKISAGDFLEHAEFSGNLYGTSKAAVEAVQKTGRICILDVDMQGVKSIKNTDLNAKFIFVKPPSVEILEQRLRGRGTENEDAVQRRLTIAKEELEYGNQKGAYHHVITNDDLEVACEKLKGILITDIEAQQKQGH